MSSDLPMTTTGSGTDSSPPSKAVDVFEDKLKLQLHQAEEEAKQAEEQARILGAMPIEERITSAKLEHKLHGVKELRSLLDNIPEELPEAVSVNLQAVIDLMKDKNAALQKEALDVVGRAFLYMPSDQIRGHWESESELLLVTMIAQTRLYPSVCELALAATAAFGDSTVINVIADLLQRYHDRKGVPTMKGPQSKTVAGLFSLAQRVLNEFGLPPIKIQPLAEHVKVFVSATDRAVKEAVYKYACEIFVWTRSLELAKSGMDPKQATELEKRVKPLMDELKATPQRRFRGAAIAQTEMKAGALSKQPVAETVKDEEIDVWEMLPGVDLFAQVHVEKWEREVRDSVKWSEKKDALESLILPLGQCKKIQIQSNTSACVKQVYSVCTIILQQEVNIAVLTMAVRVCDEIAGALRSHMAQDVAKSMLHMLVPKLKDRNKTLQNVILECMTTFTHVLPLDVFLEDIVTACKDKNPQLRLSLLQWLTAIVDHPAAMPDEVTRCCRKIVNFALELIDDTQATVRAASAKMLLRMAQTNGNIVEHAIGNLTGKKKTTAREAVDRIAKEEGQPMVNATSTPPRRSESNQGSSNVGSVKKGLRPGPQPSTSGKSSPVTSSMMKTYTEEDVSNISDMTATIEECEHAVAEMFKSTVENNEIIQGCRNSSDWKDRSANLDMLRADLIENPDRDDVFTNRQHVASLLLYLKTLSKDLRENNTMVVRKLMETIGACLERIADLQDQGYFVGKSDFRQPLEGIPNSPISAPLATALLRHTFEKMGDSRINKTGLTLFLLVAEILTPLFVWYLTTDQIKKTSNLKNQSEGIGILSSIVSEFSPLFLPTPVVLETYRDLLADGRPTAKKAMHVLAVAIMATRHVPSGRHLISALNQVKSNRPVKPVAYRDLESLAYIAAANPHLALPAAGSFPRRVRAVVTAEHVAVSPEVHDVPLAQKVTPQFLKDLRDPSWKVRRDRLLEIIEFCSPDRRIQPSAVLSDFATTLRTRLQTESNRIVLKALVEACEALPQCFDDSPQLRQAGRIILPSVLTKFADRSAQLSTGALSTLRSWLVRVGLFVWVNATIFPAGGNVPVKLAPDRKEQLYNIVSAEISSPAAYFGNPDVNPEGQTLLPFLSYVIQDCNVDKPQSLKDVSREVVYLCLAGLTDPEAHQLEMAIGSLKESSLGVVLEELRKRAQPHVSEASRQMEDTVSSQSSLRMSRQSPSRDRIIKAQKLHSTMALLPNPANVTPTQREAHFVRNGGLWPFVLRPEHIESLGQEWAPHASPALFDTMFPELSKSGGVGARVNRLNQALSFWFEIMDFDTVNLRGAENAERPPCVALDTRLGSHVIYERVFSHEEGLTDILFKWICWRLGDSAFRIARQAAELLQVLLGRLIAAQNDARSLIEHLKQHPAQSGLDPNEVIAYLETEGKVSLTQVNMLLPHLLERSAAPPSKGSGLDESNLEMIRDVMLALTFVTPDPAALFHTTLRMVPRRPEILELTSFLIEQHGWRLCRDILQELQDFARWSLSPETDPDTQHFSAQCLSLILLSLPRSEALEALRELDRAVPGVKKHISKFVKQNPLLLHVYPVDGLPPLTEDAKGNLNLTLDEDETVEIRSSSTPGHRDYSQEFDEMIVGSEIESRLASSKHQMIQSRMKAKIQNAQLLLQDFLLEIRKEKEGRNISIEYEMRYWNAVRRIEYVQKTPQVEHVTILLETSRLAASDLSLIKEAAVRLRNILNDETLNEQASDWPILFSSELVTACSKALFTVFRTDSFFNHSESNLFDETAEAVTQLTLSLVKVKRVLYPISPSQLKFIFRAVMTAMSSHAIWASSPISDQLVEQLNNIMGLHLMGVVSPRTASSLIEVNFDFLMSTSTDSQVGQPPHLIDLGLYLRVFRRLLRKLNTKHSSLINKNSTTPQASSDGSFYPLSSHDRLNYLRLIDVSLMCLLFVEIKCAIPSFGQLMGEDTVDSSNTPDSDFSLRLRETLEICLKELLEILFAYCPHLCGIYFRDKGFKSQHTLQSLCQSILEGRNNFDIPTDVLTIVSQSTYLPLIIKPDLSRTDFVAFCLERLMRKLPSRLEPDGSEATNHGPNIARHSSYFELHEEIMSSGLNRLILPPVLPEFGIDHFVENAPANHTIKSSDSSLAHGWARRRDAIYASSDGQKAPLEDIIPAAELLRSWQTKTENLRQALNTTSPQVIGCELNQSSDLGEDHQTHGDKLTRLAMRFRQLKAN